MSTKPAEPGAKRPRSPDQIREEAGEPFKEESGEFVGLGRESARRRIEPLVFKKSRWGNWKAAEIPLEVVGIPQRIKFEGANMFYRHFWTKKLHIDPTTLRFDLVEATPYYELLADDDPDNKLITCWEMKDGRGGKALYVDSFFYDDHGRNATRAIVDGWATEKFGSERKIKALRSKRGAKFLRLVQIDLAAFDIMHGRVPKVRPVWLYDSWRPAKELLLPENPAGTDYWRLYSAESASHVPGEIGFADFSDFVVETFVGGGENPTPENSRLGDDIMDGVRGGWPSIEESLMPLFPEGTSEEIRAKARVELKRFELPPYDSAELAAQRIKKKTTTGFEQTVNGSIYGLYQDPDGRVIYGTAGSLYKWAVP